MGILEKVFIQRQLGITGINWPKKVIKPPKKEKVGITKEL